MTIQRRAHRPGRWEAAKPDYRLLERGTTFLFDTANVIGELGPEHAARHLKLLERELYQQGYPVIFIWEWDAYTWAFYNQAQADEMLDLERFVLDGRQVQLVHGEADLALLQMARAKPRSVIMTNDQFRDYRGVYGDIVGTERVKAFSVLRFEGTYLSIVGLEGLVELDAPPAQVSPVESPETTELTVGERRRAFRRFEIAACHGKAEGWLGMAWSYRLGIGGVERNEGQARRCEGQARRLTEKTRDLERWRARRRVWARKGGAR